MKKIICIKCKHDAEEHEDFAGCMHEHGERVCNCFLSSTQVMENHYKKIIKELKAELREERAKR